MITKRLLALQMLLILGLGIALILPKHLAPAEAGVILDLPSYIGSWYGRDTDVTEKEKLTLGPETEFARKKYGNGLGDSIDVSVVLAGEDMNTSIHRPERCLPAQGYTIESSNTQHLDLGAQSLSVTRLRISKPATLTNGQTVVLHSVQYYWFIGSKETTSSHMTRELIDVRDRVFTGTVQRWAYITITSYITQNVQAFGRSEKETDKLLQDFLKRLIPLIEKQTVVNS